MCILSLGKLREDLHLLFLNYLQFNNPPYFPKSRSVLHSPKLAAVNVLLSVKKLIKGQKKLSCQITVVFIK